MHRIWILTMLAATALATLIVGVAASIAPGATQAPGVGSARGADLGSYLATLSALQAETAGDPRMAGRFTLVLKRNGTYNASNPARRLPCTADSRFSLIGACGSTPTAAVSTGDSSGPRGQASTDGRSTAVVSRSGASAKARARDERRRSRTRSGNANSESLTKETRQKAQSAGLWLTAEGGGSATARARGAADLGSG